MYNFPPPWPALYAFMDTIINSGGGGSVRVLAPMSLMLPTCTTCTTVMGIVVYNEHDLDHQ